jgi:prophage regulatory protein
MSHHERILRWREVAERVNLSRTTVWRLTKFGRFPRAVKISDGAVGWRETEIVAWLTSRTAA